MVNKFYQTAAMNFYRQGWLSLAAYYAKLSGDEKLARGIKLEANENDNIKEMRMQTKYLTLELKTKGEAWIPETEEGRERLLDNLQVPRWKKKNLQQQLKEIITA